MPCGARVAGAAALSLPPAPHARVLPLAGWRQRAGSGLAEGRWRQLAHGPHSGSKQRAAKLRQGEKENWPPGCLGASLSSGKHGTLRVRGEEAERAAASNADHLPSAPKTPALNWCASARAATAPRFCAIARQWQLSPLWQPRPCGEAMLEAERVRRQAGHGRRDLAKSGAG